LFVFLCLTRGFTAIQSFVLGGVGLDDGHDQTIETPANLVQSTCVVERDTIAFTPNEAGFSENPEVLRKGRLGDVLITELEQCRAGLRALSVDDIGKDAHADGIRECVQDALNRDVFEWGMEKRSHFFLIPAS
jgi:hypothetical protein